MYKFLILPAVFKSIFQKMLISALILFCIMLQPAFAADKRSEIECDCDATGNYSVPNSITAPALGDVLLDATGSSPNGTYTYTVEGVSLAPSPGMNVYLTVKQGKTIKADISVTVTQAAWGFSPDDHRFVVHGINSNAQYFILLYDLKAEGKDNVILDPSPALFTDYGNLTLGFSPTGRYFSYAVCDSDNKLTLKLLDVKAPANDYDASLYITPATVENAGLAAWGFAANDGGFLYAWKTDANTVSYKLVNLQQMEEVIDNGVAYGGTWWGFSPCGDVFALVDGYSKTMYAYSTLDGASPGGGGYQGMANELKPTCNADNHYLGEDSLFENTADDPCPAESDSDGDGIPDDEDNCPDTSNPAQEDTDGDGIGDACEDSDNDEDSVPNGSDNCPDEANQDQLDPDNDGIGTACDNCPDVSNPDQEDSDGDGTGNACENKDNEPPEWPSGAELNKTEIGETSVRLTWPVAEDNVGVAIYLVYKQISGNPVELVAKVPGNELTYFVTGLEASEYYTLKVEARDGANHTTVNGPATFVITTDETPPSWPPDSILTVSDRDQSSMTLEWPEAVDNVQVTGYRLYLLDYVSDPDPTMIADLPGNITLYRVSCLKPGTGYIFNVEAGDVADNWSEDGPFSQTATDMGQECSITTERVSVSGNGEQMWTPEGAGGVENLTVSSDGRFVAFSSSAVVDMEDHGWTRVYLHDRESEHTSIVSVSSDGDEANCSSGTKAGGGDGQLGISSDGRYVAFASGADNLVYGDNNDTDNKGWDVFVRDRNYNSTERVSVSSAGAEGTGGWIYGSHSPDISGDGRYVVFVSEYTNLVQNDTNGNTPDIFVHDRQENETRLVSISSSGEQANSNSWKPSISADGRFICFNSMADNLIADDTNNHGDVFVHDRDVDEDGIFDESGSIDTSIVSISSLGYSSLIWDNVNGGTISADGRYVAFNAYRDSAWNVFVHDRVSGNTQLISVSIDGQPFNCGNCYVTGSLSISDNGRFVIFDSTADNLVPDDTNGVRDVFIHDRITATTRRVSICPCGDEGNLDSHGSGINGNGSIVAFISQAGNLLAGLTDTNNENDAFIHQWQSVDGIFDTDFDGVDDDEESLAPNSGDNNEDGIQDKEQPNVVSLQESESGRYVTFVSPEGTQFAGMTDINRESLQDSPPITGSYPFGFFEFQLFGVAPEEPVEVQLYLPSPDEVDSFYKYGPTPQNDQAHWYPFLFNGATGAQVGSDMVTLKYADGLWSDIDLTSDGDGGIIQLASSDGVIGEFACPAYVGKPVFTSEPVEIAIKDMLYTYDVDADDPDGDNDDLEFSLPDYAAPEGMEIDEDTGVIEWTPDDSQLGDNYIIVHV